MKKPTKKPVAPKPTKKSTKPKVIKIEKQVVTDLASCVLWALKFLKTQSGAGLHFDPTTMISTPWQEKFMKALDGVGYQIDRKDFWKKQDKKRSRK